MATFTFPLFLSLLLPIFAFAASAETGTVGINYGRIADNLPPPEKVVALLKSQGINKVKLYDTDATVLTALANSGISVVVALPNDLLSSAASDPSFADKWVQSNISHYHPKTQIEAIAVGNEVFVDPNNTTQFLVPAIKNIQSSLVKYNLSSIKLSSPIALSSLNSSYPPSAGAFKPDLIEPVIKPLLEFLTQTSSYLMINAYPFFAYESTSDKISLDYALFRTNPGNPDSGNGLKYYSLLEAQIDAVFAAMSAVGHGDVKVVVTETGWPSKGDENEIGSGQANAAAYNGNLVRRVLTGGGTPLKPKDPLNVYLFALFNEDQKPGPTSERNYGLFYPDETKVYGITLTAAGLSGDQSSPANESKVLVPTASPSAGSTWCVANAKAGEEKLQAALDYACGEGGADCRPIQEGSTCFTPNTLEAHASYAFNSFYQKRARGTGTCNFGGAAYVVAQPPKYGTCEFPTGY
ncbi:glucan endo-1,3-beta-glucosidase 14 [Pyrus x bretschneideri]|uniref:glucan endo-1,3-beta-glucosidase 14 n=1 Tax=Pyrus x bretschneideri TaxID=225117 RepID=UPI00051199FD|nr:glucan endo-1,3-beta-glucosidase 14 [Pyrus x bretschneideri]